MALTITKKLPNGIPDVIGGYTYLQVADILFDSSYPTGGEPLTLGDLGFPTGTTVVQFVASPALGFTFEYDVANAKLKVRVPGVVVAAAGAATMDDFALTGVGASTARSVSLDNAAGAGTHRFGGMVEVANTENLSTVTTRIVAVAAVI